MTNLNVTVLEGCVTNDAELKRTRNGKPYCVFTLVVNRDYKTGEEWVEQASFFNLSIWGSRAERVFKYLRKGAKIAIEGYLEQTRWDDNGEKKSRIDIRVNMLHLLSKIEKESAKQKSESELSSESMDQNNHSDTSKDTAFNLSDEESDDYGEIF